jgi:hypothetical protein
MSSMQSSRDKDLYYGNYNTMMIYDYLYSTATDSTVHVWFADAPAQDTVESTPPP